MLSLFGFDDAAKKVADVNKFSIGDLVFKAIEAITKWFKGLLDIDFGAVFTKLIGKIPGGKKIMKFFGIGGKESEAPTTGQNEVTST